MRSFASGVLLALVLWGGLGAPSILAQERGGVPDSIRQAALEDFHGPDLEGKDGPLAKAGLDLLLLYHQGRVRSGERPSPRPARSSAGGLQVQDGRVAVDAIAAGDVSALAADLDSLGATGLASAGGLVSARIPIAKIPDLARLESLRGVQPARARTRTGRSGDTAAPRPSRSSAGDRPAPSSGRPSPDSAAPPSTEEGPLEEAPPPEPTPAAGDEADAVPSPGGDPLPSAAAASPPEGTAPSPPTPENSSTAVWGVLALAAIVLFLEEL